MGISAGPEYSGPMSGFLRRLRGRRPKDDEAEAGDEPVEGEPSGDTDIYPHRSNDRPDDPDIAAAPEPAPIDASEPEPPRPPTVAPGPRPSSAPRPTPGPRAPAAPAAPMPAPERTPDPAPPPAVPAVAPEVAVVPSSAPPPLPLAGTDLGSSSHRPLTAPTRCFLCGSEMTGSYCPVCRMTWNE